MNKQKIFTFFILTWVLSSCTQWAINWNNWWEIVKEPILDIDRLDGNADEANIIESEEWNKDLTINPSCIWCSNCVRIAPLNFTMNNWTRKAEVISQLNISSDEVAKAIKVCPVNAIWIG